MGNTDSQKPIQQEFQIIRTQRTGNVHLKSKIDQKEYLMRVISSSNKTDLERTKSLLECRAVIKNDHLLSLVDIKQKEKENMCSKHYNLFVVLEYSFKPMIQEIIERSSKVQKHYFNENELWSIIYSCSSALNALYSNGATHESISYNNIYINAQGYIKMADPLLFGLEKNYIYILNNYQRFLETKQNNGIHLSPQIVQCLDEKNFQFYDRQMSDIFILGMVIIDFALLKFNSFYYTKQQFNNLGIIPALMKELSERYSYNIINLLQKMLMIEANKRLSFIQVIKTIQKYNNTANGKEQSIQLQTLKKDFKNQTINQTTPIVVKQTIKPLILSKPFNEYESKKITQPIIPTSQPHINNSLGHYQNSLSIKEGYNQLNNQNFDGKVFKSTIQTQQTQQTQQIHQRHQTQQIHQVHQSNLNNNSVLYSKHYQPSYQQKNYFNDIKISKPQSNNQKIIIYDNPNIIKSVIINENHYSGENIQNNQKIKISQNVAKQFHHHQPMIINHPIHARTINNQQVNTVYLQNVPQPNLSNISVLHNQMPNGELRQQFKSIETRNHNIHSRSLNNSYQKHISSPNKPQVVMAMPKNNPANRSINYSIKTPQQVLSKNTMNYKEITTDHHKGTFSTFSGLKTPASTPVNIPINNYLHQASPRQKLSSFQSANKKNIININSNLISQIKSNNRILNNIKFVHSSTNTPRAVNHQIIQASNNESLKKEYILLNTKQVQEQTIIIQNVKNQFINNNVAHSHSNFEKSQLPIHPFLNSKPHTKINFSHEIPEVHNIMYNNSKAPINTQLFTKEEKNIIISHDHVSAAQNQQMIKTTNRFINYNDHKAQTISQFIQYNSSIHSPNYKQLNQTGTVKKDGQRIFIKQAVSHQFKEPIKMPIKQPFSIKAPEKNHHFQHQKVVFSSNQRNQIALNKISDKYIPLDQISVKTQTYITDQPINITNLKLQNPAPNFVNRQLQYVEQQIADKGRYKGYKFENKKQGQGILFFKDGGHYNGQWKNDRMEGYGKLYYENGSIAYEGCWKNDEFYGKGRVYNSQPTPFVGEFDYRDFSDLENKWVYYDGQFKNDQKNGRGYIKLANGQMFEGLFDHDMIQGNGIFYKSSGEIVVGYWINNRLFLDQSFATQDKKHI